MRCHTASPHMDAGFVIWADLLWENGNSPASTVEDSPDSIVLIRSEYEEALRRGICPCRGPTVRQTRPTWP